MTRSVDQRRSWGPPFDCGYRRGERWHRLWTSPPGSLGELAAPQAEAPALTVALVGMPNTGKSTLYNRLTGGHAPIANWPSLTAERPRGAMPCDGRGRRYTLVDLPGIDDLGGSSENEAAVQRFLRTAPPALLLVVLNASQLSNQLGFVPQLRRLGIPLVVALNKSDEARQRGIRIDHRRLREDLGLPLLPVSAKRNQGIHDLIQAVHRLGESLPDAVAWPAQALASDAPSFVARTEARAPAP
ncbi:MAG: FeoB small GTPase domain-containing protein [Cyanobacteria bacterium J06638_7]